MSHTYFDHDSKRDISWECGDTLTRADGYDMAMDRPVVAIVNHTAQKQIIGLPENEPTMWLKLAMACVDPANPNS